MVSQRSQASAAATPSPGAAGADTSPASAGSEPRSPATAGTATPGATGDQGKDGSLPELTEEVLRNHPAVREYVARMTQSRADRLVYQERLKWEKEQKAAVDAEAWRKARDEELAADEYELGKKRKEELQREITIEPYREQFLKQGHQLGYQAAYAELAGALEQNPLWKNLPEAERADLIRANPDLPGLITALAGRQAQQEAETLAERKAQARLEKELAKFQTAASREERAEARGREPSPSVGTGVAVAGAMTQEEWDRNRGDPAWRRANLPRLQEAVASRRVRR